MKRKIVLVFSLIGLIALVSLSRAISRQNNTALVDKTNKIVLVPHSTLKELVVAKQNLSDMVDAAEYYMKQADGARKIERAVDATERIDHAKKVIETMDIADHHIYIAERQILSDEMEKVRSDVKEWRIAEEERKKAEETIRIERERAEAAAKEQRKMLERYQRLGAPTPAKGRQTSNSGAWNVYYRNDYGSATGASDGAVTQWADGYYIAHDWSANGKMIASRPATVNVDGMAYRYVDSMVVPIGTTWEQVSGWVRRNGGIGFQTCTAGGYLITHYEPI